MAQTKECPECGEEVTTPVCTHCHAWVRERTPAEAREVGLVPNPDLNHLRRQADAVAVATPGDRISVARGDS